MSSGAISIKSYLKNIRIFIIKLWCLSFNGNHYTSKDSLYIETGPWISLSPSVLVVSAIWGLMAKHPDSSNEHISIHHSWAPNHWGHPQDNNTLSPFWWNLEGTQLKGLVQDCSNSSALAMELLQSCTNHKNNLLHLYHCIQLKISLTLLSRDLKDILHLGAPLLKQYYKSSVSYYVRIHICSCHTWCTTEDTGENWNCCNKIWLYHHVCIIFWSNTYNCKKKYTVNLDLLAIKAFKTETVNISRWLSGRGRLW